MAVTLATGLGVHSLQARVDRLESRAVAGDPFTNADRAFLRDLYRTLQKGAWLTFVLRQSSQLMDHYLDGTGEDLHIDARLFLGSRRVRERMAMLGEQVEADVHSGSPTKQYDTADFYMGDPAFFDSFVGLYVGRLFVEPEVLPDGSLLLRWRAEMPWQWPTYASLEARYGTPHAQSFPLPNARSLLAGPEHALYLDDGLGGYLAQLGLARPFMVYSAWQERRDPAPPAAKPAARTSDERR